MLLEVWKKGHEFALKNMADMLKKILQKQFPIGVFVKTAVTQISSTFTGEHPCGKCHLSAIGILLYICCIFAKHIFEEHLLETASEFVMLEN